MPNPKPRFEHDPNRVFGSEKRPGFRVLGFGETRVYNPNSQSFTLMSGTAQIVLLIRNLFWPQVGDGRCRLAGYTGGLTL